MFTNNRTPACGLAGRAKASFAASRPARRVYLSFDYHTDLSRVNRIRDIPGTLVTAAAGFRDAELWNATRGKGEAAVRNLIESALDNASVTVVCIGSQASGYGKYLDYELERSLELGKGIVGVHIGHLQDDDGVSQDKGRPPLLIKMAGYKVHDYVSSKRLARHIEEAARLAKREGLGLTAWREPGASPDALAAAGGP